MSLMYFLAWRRKSSTGLVETGTPWSGQDANQKCVTSRDTIFYSEGGEGRGGEGGGESKASCNKAATILQRTQTTDKLHTSLCLRWKVVVV